MNNSSKHLSKIIERLLILLKLHSNNIPQSIINIIKPIPDILQKIHSKGKKINNIGKTINKDIITIRIKMKANLIKYINKLLKELDIYYFQKDISPIPDKEYDTIVSEYKQFIKYIRKYIHEYKLKQQKNGGNIDITTQRIKQLDIIIQETKKISLYLDKKLPKDFIQDNDDLIHHHKPMLSLKKSFTIKEIYKFSKNIQKNLKSHNIKQDIEFIIEPKIDGTAISLLYENGILKNAVTRGNGKTGYSIIKQANHIESIPKKIDYKGSIELRGEIYCYKDKLKLLQNTDKLKTSLNLSRSISSGSLKLKSKSEIAKRPLGLFIYQILNYDQNLHLKKQSDILAHIKVLGFKTSNILKNFTIYQTPNKAFITKYINNIINLLHKNYSSINIEIQYQNGKFQSINTKYNFIKPNYILKLIPNSITNTNNLNIKTILINPFKKESFIDEDNIELFIKDSFLIIKDINFKNYNKTQKYYINSNIENNIENAKLYTKLYFQSIDIGFDITYNYEQLSLIYNIYKHIECFNNEQDKFNYDIDGLVIKLNHIELYNIIGLSTKYPKWAIAYKFKNKESESIINNISLEMSRFGILTPIANIEPVNIEGSNIKNISLYNLDFIHRNNYNIGTRVVIEKAGGVIPKLSRAINNTGKYIPPNFCPYCNSKIILHKDKNITLLKCPNTKCSERIIEETCFICSNEVFNIKSISNAKIRSFITSKLIESPYDIFKLESKVEDIKNIRGFNDKIIKKIIKNINNSKKTSLDKVILSLNINKVGTKHTKTLTQEFSNLKSIYSFCNEVNNKVFNKEIYNILKYDIKSNLLDEFVLFLNSDSIQYFKNIYKRLDLFINKDLKFNSNIKLYKKGEVDKFILTQLDSTNIYEITKNINSIKDIVTFTKDLFISKKNYLKDDLTNSILNLSNNITLQSTIISLINSLYQGNNDILIQIYQSTVSKNCLHKLYNLLDNKSDLDYQDIISILDSIEFNNILKTSIAYIISYNITKIINNINMKNYLSLYKYKVKLLDLLNLKNQYIILSKIPYNPMKSIITFFQNTSNKKKIDRAIVLFNQ